MEIFYSSKFKRSFRKLPKELAMVIDERINIFSDKPFDNRLKTHRLGDRLKGLWSFSITHKHRIIFEFNKKGNIYFHSVGVHTVYQ